MTINYLSADSDIEAIETEIKSNGCVIIEDLIDKSTVEQIKSDLVPHLTPTPVKDKFAGRHTKRAGLVIARSPKARELIMHPKVLEVTEKALSHSTNFQLHNAQVLAVGPGSELQPIHRDQWAFDFFPFPSGFDTTLSTMWALTDFTAENGATRLVPGSHKVNESSLEEALSTAKNLTINFEEETKAAEMKAGSVLFYTGSLYHGAGPNSTESVRIGLTIQYTLGWLRQEENQYLGNSSEVLNELPEDLLRLMGYKGAASSLGFYDNLKDPMAAIRPELEKDFNETL
jgi:ectoine hydroxylase-related dioxygenase (phytanoyl-CoA dioxygenase family)|tara:strand:+ start:361 stop:1221 length:861 start_codon:yes stop_codon:yes gene_type:complete